MNPLFPDIRSRLEKAHELSRKQIFNSFDSDDIARLLKAVDLAVETLEFYTQFYQSNAKETLAQLKALSEGRSSEDSLSEEGK